MEEKIKIALFLNGISEDLIKFKSEIDSCNFKIAVDGGFNHINFQIDYLIGDLDSINKNYDNINVIKYPKDKDLSDFELALDFALSKNANEIIIFNSFGGRIDYSLNNFLLPTLDKYKSLNIAFYNTNSTTYIVRDNLLIKDKSNRIISLIPLADQNKLSISGMKWNLNSKMILRGESLTMSNKIVDSNANICVENGIFLVIIEN